MKFLQHTPINRRGFLQVSASATAALSLGFSLPADAQANQHQEVNAWIDIYADESIVIRYARTEMGQGSRTSAPMLIAEELEVDWQKVRVEHVQAHENLKRKRAYGDMASVGSRTIRNSQEYLRKAGASARMMLVQAAAQRWGVPESECQAVLGKVVHPSTKKSFKCNQFSPCLL
jgi:isoquinoline 1-oxidoreductase beta subunit